ncbi:hypothetical protein NEOLEDRAFT_948037 [Neolentinus lepideus HHB14362 ss-1]|uniref:Non-specific serine/threonine protein kinase n=1 Tax=Neolentinus lepideus HHB14362 ss-1 TaxID=1314782 RepID=A0A165UD15_9AGAM|nr:hypothetical protein NEOLEDRAFT_948037 [Neolentinus lepideus HHB14362 ss-1]
MKSFINVHFSDVEDERPSTLKLTPRQGAKLHGDVYALKEIHRSRHSVVYRGTVAITEYPVVLKLAYTDDTVADLRKEVALYSHQLLGLQGTVVPACFGLYEESSGGTCTGCLVLEDCGDPPDVSLEDLPMRQRVVVLRNLQKLHWAGVQHDDYRRQNIVIRDGQIRVIDFNKTSPHSCECPIEIKRPMERPDVLDFKCWNLYVFCIDLSVWSPYIWAARVTLPRNTHPRKSLTT